MYASQFNIFKGENTNAIYHYAVKFGFNCNNTGASFS